jgi:hypothetical protein
LHERNASQVSRRDKPRQVSHNAAAERYNKGMALEAMFGQSVIADMDSLESLGGFACGDGQEKGSEPGLFERSNRAFRIERGHIPIGNDGAPPA